MGFLPLAGDAAPFGGIIMPQNAFWQKNSILSILAHVQ
jgi:hypothetical protein